MFHQAELIIGEPRSWMAHFVQLIFIASILESLLESKWHNYIFFIFLFRSKTRTSWHFDLDTVRYCFELEHSVMTGKKRILRNSCIVYEEKSLRSQLSYEMTIGKHQLVFTQNGEKFDLRIDNESFMYLYN